jgi:methionine-rich copper-binding protein CopC
VRKNWKKRLSVWSALTLLSFMLTPMLAAHAQVTTEKFGITASVITTIVGDTPDTFSYQVNGGPETPFPANGTIQLDLDVTGTYTITPVAKAGYTATVGDDIPGVDCTDATIVVGTPGFCFITFEEIVAPTTTTTTTTTTTEPRTTTSGGEGQVTIENTAEDTNRCGTVLVPDIQPPGNTDIKAVTHTFASPQPHRGDPISLSGTDLTITIPATLLQLGVDAGLIHNGDQIPSTLTYVVAGSNTAQGTHTYVVNQSVTINLVGNKAKPLTAHLNFPDTIWTPTGGDVRFTEKSLTIISRLNLPGIGNVRVNFTCTPRTAAQFIAVGETGAVQGTLPPATGGPGPTGPGGTDPTVGSNELPRTGSAPWPLVIIAAGLIDLGFLAIAGSRRRRRPLHQS